jgi:hypothetical protein
MPQGGRYILCDGCEKETFSINLPWPHDGKTVDAALQAGWSVVSLPIVRRRAGKPHLFHICPACTAAGVPEKILS